MLHQVGFPFTFKNLNLALQLGKALSDILMGRAILTWEKVGNHPWALGLKVLDP